MPVESRVLSFGKKWRFDKKIKGHRLTSQFIYKTKNDATQAEYDTVMAFLHGKKTPLASTNILSVDELLKRRVLWLKEHRNIKHAVSTENAFKRAMFFVHNSKDTIPNYFET